MCLPYKRDQNDYKTTKLLIGWDVQQLQKAGKHIHQPLPSTGQQHTPQHTLFITNWQIIPILAT